MMKKKKSSYGETGKNLDKQNQKKQIDHRNIIPYLLVTVFIVFFQKGVIKMLNPANLLISTLKELTMRDKFRIKRFFAKSFYPEKQKKKPVTERQLRALVNLAYSGPVPVTKFQAGELIDKLLKNRGLKV